MLSIFIFAAFAPAVFAAALLLATGALKSDRNLHWTMPVAIVVGFGLAQYWVDGFPRFPPIEASGWFTPIAIVLGILAVAGADKLQGVARLVMRVVVAVAMIVTVVWPLIGPTWTAGVAAAWIIGMGALTVVTWTSLDATSAVAPGPGLPLALLINAAGVGAVLAVSGSARYGQLAGAVASVMGPVTILGLIRKNSPLLRNSAWVAYVLLAMLLVAGVAFVDVPLPSAVLVAIAPVGFRVGELEALKSRPWWQRELVRVGVAVLFVAIAAVLAMPKPDPSGY